MYCVIWVGYSYVDIGAGVDDDIAPVATEALVFMVVSLNQHWKVPIVFLLLMVCLGMNGPI